MLKVTTFLKDISPALCRRIISLYVSIGEEPVGNPNTKGFAEVGYNRQFF